MSNSIYSNFNMEKSKQAIRQMLNDKGIKHKTAYEYLQMTQPDFSKKLSDKEKTFFTISQLWDLSNLLSCSIDELLGKNNIPQKNIDHSDNISLSDVCEALNYFNQIANPKYGISQNGTAYIYSSTHAVDELIKKFSNMKDMPDVLSYFSQGFIRDHRNALKKYNFRTEYECGKEIILKILNDSKLLTISNQILKSNGIGQTYSLVDSLRVELTNICELYSEAERMCIYKAIPQYIEENNILEGSEKNLILGNLMYIHENNHTK